MPDIRIHYSDLLIQLFEYFVSKISTPELHKNFDNSDDFKNLKSSYKFDMENSEEIDTFICKIASNSNLDLTKYSKEIQNAVFIRITCLSCIFNAQYVTPFLNVPSDLSEAAPLILVEFWKSARMFVELELET
ncbi:MAG: hypothetical protein IJN40_05090 [Clostridia bacterium]|nr:hypothetical protein [Clostridia bacterium]